MSQEKGVRLWFQPDRYYANGKLKQLGRWVIRDGSRKISTGCAREDFAGAQRKKFEYEKGKYEPSRTSSRSPAEILVLDVLNIYSSDVASKHARPEETAQRIKTLSKFWKPPYTLADVKGQKCREYVAWRTKQTVKSFKSKKPRLVTEATARRELEDLRAAINYHRQEGFCSEIVAVALPEKGVGRDAWLTRQQAACLLRAAWRHREKQNFRATDRHTLRHIARFILIGLYTGTRHAAICGAALQPAIGRGHVDLEGGVFHRRARGARETKKRQPPAPLSPRLLAHLRRWQRLGIAKHAVVEWNGKPVRSVRKGFAAAAKAAGLPLTGPDKVTPHVLRHTSATWAMRARADLWETAKLLGMTVEMLENRYGHHRPDFLADAAEKIASSPGRRTVNKRS